MIFFFFQFLLSVQDIKYLHSASTVFTNCILKFYKIYSHHVNPLLIHPFQALIITLKDSSLINYIKTVKFLPSYQLFFFLFLILW